MPNRLIPIFALGLLIGGVALATVPGHAADSDVVATINGKPITKGDLAVAESEIGSSMGSMPAAQKQMSLLEFLIDNQLFAEAGEKLELGETQAFKTRLNYLKRRALREVYFEQIIKASVTDEDARKIYDAQVGQLKPEEEVNARHILVETEDQAKELKKKLEDGADFAKLAKENSKDPGSKDNGGDLGYFGRGQMVPKFEKAVFALEKGQISDPIETQFGWHLVKMEDRRKKEPPKFDVVKDRIVQSLLLQKAQKTAANLRNKAKIEFVDPDIKKAIEERNKMVEESNQKAKQATEEKTPAGGGKDSEDGKTEK